MSDQWNDAFGVDAPPDCPPGGDRWARAVRLGALGRAAAARALIADLLADPATGAGVTALALATRASLTRQAGGHGYARADDGAALRVAVSAGAEESRWAAVARVDALVGLAADGLGIGDFAGSARLLERAAAESAGTVSTAARGNWVLDGRPALRLAWVRTELALYTGRSDAADLAARALELSAGAPSVRHRLKTALIAAAADAASGRVEAAAQTARNVAGDCAAAGLAPLEWAARSMLASFAADRDEQSRAAAAIQEKLIGLGMGFAPLAGSAHAARYA